ncbi:MAG: hypothetical protein DRJ34_04565, partial [Thermoprotei archaeon]
MNKLCAISILLFLGLLINCYGEIVHKISPSLERLLSLGESGERVLLVLLKPVPEIRMLLEDHSEDYAIRTNWAFSSDYVQAAIREVCQYGELYDGGRIRQRRGEPPKPGPVYIFYLNALLIKASIQNIPAIASLPQVSAILDGELPIRIPQPVERRTYVGQRAAYDWDTLTSNNWGFENGGGNQVKSLIPRNGWNGLFMSIIDTGFDEQHPLANWDGEDTVFQDGKFNIGGVSYYWSDFDAWDDDGGHGTETAGIVWQFSPNAWFYIHEAPTILYQVVQSFQTAKEWNADIITTSLGPTTTSCPCNETSDLCEAATEAADLQTLVLNAAGNCANGDT